jgi:hypothetical protein
VAEGVQGSLDGVFNRSIIFLKHIYMQKLSYEKLGKRVFLSMELGEKSEQQFNLLSLPQQEEVLGIITEYLSKIKYGNLSLREAKEFVQNICKILQTVNPFNFKECATRRNFAKYLGYSHVFSLVYGWSFDKIRLSIVDKRFSAGLIKRQKKLLAYQRSLSWCVFNLSDEERERFRKSKELIEKKLSEMKYDDLKETIVAFEEKYKLEESLYAIVESTDVESTDETDQITGMFNAVVTTFSQLSELDFSSKNQS